MSTRYDRTLEPLLEGGPSSELMPATRAQRGRRLAGLLAQWGRQARARALRIAVHHPRTRERAVLRVDRATERCFPPGDPRSPARSAAWDRWVREWDAGGGQPSEIESLIQDVVSRPKPNAGDLRAEADREGLHRATRELLAELDEPDATRLDPLERARSRARRGPALCALARAVALADRLVRNPRSPALEQELSGGQRHVLARAGAGEAIAPPEPPLEEAPVAAFLGNYPFDPQNSGFDARRAGTSTAGLPAGNPGTRAMLAAGAWVVPVLEYLGNAEDARSPSFRVWHEHREAGETLHAVLDARDGAVRIVDAKGEEARDPETVSCDPQPGRPVFVKAWHGVLDDVIAGHGRTCPAWGEGPYREARVDVHELVLVAAAALGGARRVCALVAERGQGELYRANPEQGHPALLSVPHHAGLYGLTLAGHPVTLTFGPPEHAAGIESSRNTMDPGERARTVLDAPERADWPGSAWTALHLAAALEARAPELHYRVPGEGFVPVCNPAPRETEARIAFPRSPRGEVHPTWRIGWIAPRATPAVVRHVLEALVEAARDDGGGWRDARQGRLDLVLDPASFADGRVREMVREAGREVGRRWLSYNEPPVYVRVRTAPDFTDAKLDLVVAGPAAPARDGESMDRLVEALSGPVPVLRLGEGPAGLVPGRVYVTGARADRERWWRQEGAELDRHDFTWEEAGAFVQRGTLPGLNAFRLLEDLPVVSARSAKQAVRAIREALAGGPIRHARVRLAEPDLARRAARERSRETGHFPFADLRERFAAGGLAR